VKGDLPSSGLAEQGDRVEESKRWLELGEDLQNNLGCLAVMKMCVREDVGRKGGRDEPAQKAHGEVVRKNLETSSLLKKKRRGQKGGYGRSENL